MFPIISDIALQKNIRPERPMAVASVASQMAICASPVSVAVVSMVSILAAGHGIGEAYGLLDILMIAIPSSLTGVMMAALWSLRRGKDLDKDEEFQARIKDPEQHAFIYGGGETLLNTKFPKEAYWSTWIFFAAIAAVVLLGANEGLRPVFTIKDKTGPLSMNLVIQMMMLIAGAIILMRCKVKPGEIANGAVFKAGMVAIFSVFGVAWMSETFFQAHMPLLKETLSHVVQAQPWTYALVLFLISKLVNSQAAALTAIAPMGLALGVEPKLLIAFLPASYGYFVLPTYPSDLACIGFDRSGTTRIGKFIINHSFIIPGLIGVSSSCALGYVLTTILL
jgi:anaerobic C4-dicarboxylate transporter DcuB